MSESDYMYEGNYVEPKTAYAQLYLLMVFAAMASGDRRSVRRYLDAAMVADGRKGSWNEHVPLAKDAPATDPKPSSNQAWEELYVAYHYWRYGNKKLAMSHVTKAIGADGHPTIEF